VDRGALRHSAIARHRQQPTFFNDEVHQNASRNAQSPSRNRWISQRGRSSSIGAVGASAGASAFGPITCDRASRRVRTGIAAVDAGGVAVIDVHVEPGDTPAMVTSLTRSTK
jgi:hypothetical protein